MKYAVVGAGRTGSAVGAVLALGGGEVWFVDPFAAHMQAINENGLDFDFNGTQHTIKNIHGVTSAEEAGCKVDMIVLLVKGIHTVSALPNIKGLSDEHTMILSLQNGIGNIGLLKDAGFPENRLGHGVVDFGARMTAPGHVLCQLKPGQGLHFSTVDKSHSPILEEAAACWERGGLKAEYLEDASYKIWYKLGMNCGGNVPCGLVRTNLAGYLNHPMGKKLCLCIQQEIVNIANAKGIPLTMDKYIEARTKELGPLGLHVPSTAQDMLAKIPTEIEFLYGEISREGQRLGVPTPYIDTVYMLAKIYEDTYDSQYK